jgi:hypothetical protein
MESGEGREKPDFHDRALQIQLEKALEVVNSHSTENK